MQRSSKIFLLLLAIVLLVNTNAISSSMIYIEQSPIYLANQQINSLSDLLSVYLSPKMLVATSVPFFRPSSHFLLYQIITPVLGWHNITGFIIINLVFLALCGFLMVKLYQEFFPKFLIGGYIAFSLYLMHPALVLQRLIVVQFDFSYIFFSLLSLFCFILFCKKDKNKFLFFSLASYVFAVTLKESAIVTGPLLIGYFMFTTPKHPQRGKILALLFATTTALAIYLSLAWPNVSHPFLKPDQTTIAQTISQYIQYITGTWPTSSKPWILTGIHFSMMTTIILLGLLFLSCIPVFNSFRKKQKSGRAIIFLGFSFFICLLIPIVWAAGMPWHLSLSLVFLSLVMGFGCESILHKINNQKKIYILGSIIALLIAINTYFVNQSHITDSSGITQFILTLNHNAILHPPNITTQLNAESTIIVEDSKPVGDYPLGNSTYPYPFNTIPNLTDQVKNAFFIVPDTLYGGTLFRWAYLKPSLKEQVYPFQVNKMENIPDEIIYGWLQHINNIFCLGYDTKANWHDLTAVFKKNLLAEKTRRHLRVNVYQSTFGEATGGSITYRKELPIPNNQLCKMACDQDLLCKGFIYSFTTINDHTYASCAFQNKIVLTEKKSCFPCTEFIKSDKLL